MLKQLQRENKIYVMYGVTGVNICNNTVFRKLCKP